MVVCWSPAASSIASFTARREAGEPSTGTNIFIDKSEGLWEAPMRRPPPLFLPTQQQRAAEPKARSTSAAPAQEFPSRSTGSPTARLGLPQPESTPKSDQR